MAKKYAIEDSQRGRQCYVASTSPTSHLRAEERLNRACVFPDNGRSVVEVLSRLSRLVKDPSRFTVREVYYEEGGGIHLAET